MGNTNSPDMLVRDSVTEMSNQEKYAVRETWNVFKKQLRTGSATIFVVLFVRNPEYQKLFTAFRDDPPAELPKNPRLLAHALTFAYAITSIIDRYVLRP